MVAPCLRAFLRPSAVGAALALSIVAGWALPAGAQTKRVVLESFHGPAAARVRLQLFRNLQGEGGIEFVSRDEVDRVAGELGIGGRNYDDEDYARIAAELDIAAFVDGRTIRRRRQWMVTVRVRSGADGAVGGTERWRGRTLGALSAIRRNGYTRLSAHLDAASPPDPSAVPGDGGPAVATPGQAATQADIPWYAAGGTDPERDDEEEDADASEGGARQEAFRLSFLGGSLRRSMVARAIVLNDCIPVSEAGMSYPNPSCRDAGQAVSDLSAQQASGPSVLTEDRTYESAGLGHMELGVEAELYPGALGETQTVPWLGVIGSYRHSFFLTSFGFTPDGEQIEVPTTQTELYGGARGRHRFGVEARDPEATVDVGLGIFSFELDIEALKQLERPGVVPPVSYSYVLLGGGLSYGIVPTYLRAAIEASYRVGLGVGDDAKAVWGTATSETSGWGVGVSLTSEAPYIAEGIFWGLSLEYFRFTTTYRGQTGCVDGGQAGDPNECTILDPWELWPHRSYRPADPSAAAYDDVTGGIGDPVDDDYLRLGVAFGYALR